MKNAIVTFFLIAMSWNTLSGSESELRLELESTVRTLRLGQRTNIKLKIVGRGIYEITEGTEGIDTPDLKPSAFVYEFVFKPQRMGLFTLGPYSLSFNGQTLTSNLVEINVLRQWDGRYGTFFRVDRNSIALGEDIELVMEIWTKTLEHKSITLGRDGSFSSAPGGGGGVFTSMGAGADRSVIYVKRSWFISPKKAGDFHINKELFKKFPADTTPPNISVKVKESPNK